MIEPSLQPLDRLRTLRERLQQVEREQTAMEHLLEALPRLFAEGGGRALRSGKVAELACSLTGAEAALFLPHDAGATALVAGGTAFAEPPRPPEAPLLAAALDAVDPVVVDDVVRWAPHEAAQRPYGTLAGGRLARSWIGVPVRAPGGTAHGALFCCHADPDAFTPGHVRLVRAMVANLAVVLDKEDLIEERAAVGRALQETLLPPLLPELPGLELAARYRPGGKGNLVGGDFYDLFAVGAGRFDAVLGDVSGGGPEAAAVTGIARYSIRAVAPERRCPSEVLAALNEAILRHGGDERFCTAVYLRLHPGEEGCDLQVSRAGHPAALVLRDDGSVEQLGPKTGLLLGAFVDAALEDEDVVLGPGDALLLYTDGVVEAQDAAGEHFGLERLEALLASCVGRTADGIARRVELAAIDHQHGSPRDDLAVLALRVRPRRGAGVRPAG